MSGGSAQLGAAQLGAFQFAAVESAPLAERPGELPNALLLRNPQMSSSLTATSAQLTAVAFRTAITLRPMRTATLSAVKHPLEVKASPGSMGLRPSDRLTLVVYRSQLGLTVKPSLGLSLTATPARLSLLLSHGTIGLPTAKRGVQLQAAKEAVGFYGR